MDAGFHAGRGLDDETFQFPSFRSSFRKELDSMRRSNKDRILSKIQIRAPWRQCEFITPLNTLRFDKLRLALWFILRA